jgi:hypothetical protein
MKIVSSVQAQVRGRFVSAAITHFAQTEYGKGLLKFLTDNKIAENDAPPPDEQKVIINTNYWT